MLKIPFHTKFILSLIIALSASIGTAIQPASATTYYNQALVNNCKLKASWYAANPAYAYAEIANFQCVTRIVIHWTDTSGIGKQIISETAWRTGTATTKIKSNTYITVTVWVYKGTAQGYVTDRLLVK